MSGIATIDADSIVCKMIVLCTEAYLSIMELDLPDLWLHEQEGESYELDWIVQQDNSVRMGRFWWCCYYPISAPRCTTTPRFDAWLGIYMAVIRILFNSLAYGDMR